MCGLVGAAGNLQYQDEFIVKRLLFFDYVRGPDSTGMAAIRMNGDIELAKATLNPIEFFQYEPFKKAMNAHASKALIGHNRLRTRGATSSFNAHPFQFDHIVGAHNGTLDYQSVSRLEKAIGEKFEVDSRAIFAGFAKLGVKETISLCTTGKDSKEGAWALVWFDKEKNTLNFLRNKHRDLYYCYEAGFKRMYWASEDWMLREAIKASPNAFTFHTENEKDIKNVAFFPFAADTWYQYDIDSLIGGSTKRPKPKVVSLKGREPEPVVVHTSHQDPFDRGPKAHEAWFKPQGASGTPGIVSTKTNSNQKTGCSSGSSSSTTSKLSDRQKTVVQLWGDDTHPYANIVTEAAFQSYGDKCVYCAAPVKFGDEGLTFFERDVRVLCPDCSSSNRTNSPSRIYVPGATIDMFS